MTTKAEVLAEVLARLKAAKGASRELDRAIGLAICGWTECKWEGLPMLRVDGDVYPDHPGSMYPAITESVDDVLALVEKMFPDKDADLMLCGKRGAKFTLYAGFDDLPYEAIAPTPALAILIALFSALVAKEGK